MANDDFPPIVMSESGLLAPNLPWTSNSAEADDLETCVDVPLEESGQTQPQFRGKVFRIIDDQLFIVDPGSPPPVPPT